MSNPQPNPTPNIHALPTDQRHQLQQTGRALVREIRRLSLNYREYQLAELILEMSYGWGLPSVVIPKLEVFSQFTGVSKPHIHTHLAALVEMGLVAVEKTGRGPAYRVVPQVETWRCRMRVSRATIKEAVRTVKMFNGLDDADLPPEHTDPHSFFNLPDAAHILNLAVTERGTVSQDMELL